MTTRLARPPIVEAVLDVDCDMPPQLDLGTLEATAREAFRDRYPKFRPQYVHEAKVQAAPSGQAPPKVSMRRGLQALQLLQEDDLQLVQVRTGGFSFNRLRPYSSLDDYLPEIERSWRIFVKVAEPLRIRKIRLRYINRVLLPTTDGQLNLREYLEVGPLLPDQESLEFLEFVHRHSAIEPKTGNRVTVIVASQPLEGSHLPVILDIEALCETSLTPDDWSAVLARVESLRGLKNLIFERTLTAECLKLF